MENAATKRKPPRIKKLDSNVINRIAAGEIIHRPSNALKELLENSLDANSSTIQVIAKEGGMKLLQIIDNGDGIHRDDLELLCERFTTSKIQNYEDLETIQTYGFRGEALASISHVSHLTVVTKTRDNVCAYRIKYLDGKMVGSKPDEKAEPKQCAGNDGTQIIVEDLFYNIPYRKQALKKTSEEYGRIIDVVGKYAIHNAGVAMSCRKIGAKAIGADIQTSQDATKLEVIQQIYGRSVSSNLEKFEKDLRESALAVHFEGYTSNGTYSSKKTNLLLFINNRLVENTAIRNAIEQLYSSVFPRSPKPFVYLNLEIRPQYVDVNVHPTKKEVYFLNQDQITIEIANVIQEVLMKNNNTQVISLQENTRFLSSNTTNQNKNPNGSYIANSYSKKDDASSTQNGSPYARKTHESKLVRMDSKNLSLHSFIFNGSSGKNDNKNEGSSERNEVFGSPLGFKSSTGRKPLQDIDSCEAPASPTLPTKNNKSAGSTVPSRLDRFLLKPNGGSVSTSENSTAKPSTDTAGIALSSTVETSLLSADNQLTLPQQENKKGSTGAQSAKNIERSDFSLQGAKSDNQSEIQLASKRPKVEVRLTSILELRDEWVETTHSEFTKILHGHVFVGIVDTNRALIQYETALYMVDYNKISEALFYQLTLSEFCNFGRIELNPVPKIYDLVLLALKNEIEYDSELKKSMENSKYDIGQDIDSLPQEIVSDPEGVAQAITDLIMSRSSMLEEYFNISITEAGGLGSLPMMLRDYIPSMRKLPLFLLRVGSEVDWEDEKNFFHSFTAELAYFYSTEPPIRSENIESSNAQESEQLYSGSGISAQNKNELLDTNKPANHQLAKFYHIVEYRLFPALKAGFSAPSSLVTSNSIYQIAKLPDLYRIFERC